MLKVIVIDRCEYCDGEAYLYAGEYKDGDIERPLTNRQFGLCRLSLASNEKSP